MYHNKLNNRPSYKFFLNLFLFKNNAFYNLKNLSYIHIFLTIKNRFTLKFFKFNYSYYNNFILYFTLINILTQLFIAMIII